MAMHTIGLVFKRQATYSSSSDVEDDANQTDWHTQTSVIIFVCVAFAFVFLICGAFLLRVRRRKRASARSIPLTTQGYYATAEGTQALIVNPDGSYGPARNCSVPLITKNAVNDGSMTGYSKGPREPKQAHFTEHMTPDLEHGLRSGRVDSDDVRPGSPGWGVTSRADGSQFWSTSSKGQGQTGGTTPEVHYS